MKLSPLLLLLLASGGSAAQEFTGIIKDKYSRNHMPRVSVQTPSTRTYPDANGKFTLRDVQPGDTVTFFSIGYLELNHVVSELDTAGLLISMQPISIMLAEVQVKAFRDYGADSLRFRNEYAKIFNYNKPKFSDIFIPKNFASTAPRPYYQAANSTASLISVDLLSVIGLLGKNKTPVSKLQEKLIREEGERHVDKAFSAGLIRRVTGLEGDSLTAFIQRYRPPMETAKEMSEYETIMYIRKSYAQFRSPRFDYKNPQLNYKR